MVYFYKLLAFYNIYLYKYIYFSPFNIQICIYICIIYYIVFNCI